MLRIIISLILGYFIGMASCLLQVIRMENRENEKIEEILKDYRLTDDGLTLLKGWARDGLTDEQIANNCGIRRQTLYEWKKKYSDINDTLKKSKSIVDYEVENSLLKKAFGYNAKVLKHIKVKKVDYNDDGYKVNEHEEIVEVYDEVHIPADTTAQIFWLKNRKPDKWREKQQETPNNENDHVILVDDLKDYENNKDK